MQPNISHSVALYLDSASFNLSVKYSIGCQTFPCCCSETALTAVPDASDLNTTGNSGPYNLRAMADVRASFSASKEACYSTPNFNDFLPCNISVRGAETLANPLKKPAIVLHQTKKILQLGYTSWFWPIPFSINLTLD